MPPNLGASRNDFSSNLRLLELNLDQILGLRTEFSPDFKALGFQANVGP